MAVLFAIVCVALLWLIGSAVWSIVFPDRRTWPPLKREGFVYRVNKSASAPMPPCSVDAARRA